MPVQELQPIPERVGHVEPGVARQVVVALGLETRGATRRLESVEVIDEQRRVRFPGRAEVRLHTQMDLNAAAAKPRAAARPSTC